MKTVGDILKLARIKKRYSLKKVERETKIKKEFIEAIEGGNWKALPDLPVVSGFVKNLASFLEIDVKMVHATLKRDYPPRGLLINPKPDVGGKFTWTPKYSFLLGIVIIIVMLLGYLGFQFIKFNSPPALEVTSPQENFIATSNKVDVSGKTDPDATVKINNQLVLVGSDGAFNGQVEIFEGTKEIVITATNRSKKETTIVRKIVPKLE
ncbi:MAG: helix-turn-helix domain-containing protein [Candidatus Woesebacteria bacterium]|nr:helix-turn-helix domain-containing protein [Candidatus Woesebacteria bacterium]